MAISRMKKIFIVGPDGYQDDTLRFLQDAGVVHLEAAGEIARDFEEKNSELLARVRKIDQLIKALDRFKNPEASESSLADDADLVTSIETCFAEWQKLNSRKEFFSQLRSELLPWGYIANKDIRALREDGMVLRRYRLDAKQWESFEKPKDVFLEVVSYRPDVLFYTISIGATPVIPMAIPLPWPELDLAELERELMELDEKLHQLAGRLAGFSSQSGLLKKLMIEALNEAEFSGQMSVMARDQYLFGLQGWVPEDEEKKLIKKAEALQLPLRIETRHPLEAENPPVLLKNNWFNRRVEPLLKLYGVPDYRELDPSYFFAPFMILFFGICLGDAGYGLVFFLVSLWLGKKLGPKIPGLAPVMKLCRIFAFSTIVIGLITGSVFGYNFENRQWIVLDLAIGSGNPMILFYISLGLGLIQLSTSYLIGTFQALSIEGRFEKLGLMAVLWGGAVLISRNIWFADPGSLLNAPFYYTGIGILAAGLLMTLLFSSGNKNWGIRLGLGLWSIYGLTGLVGDLLSYARLFGLGIATSAIAAVMNQLAGMVFNAAGPYIGSFLGVVVIIVGHAFNLILSILGSTVHSARLNFVESFKNFYKGGGTDYKPFKIERG